MRVHLLRLAFFCLLFGSSSALLAEEVELKYKGLTLNANLESAGDTWPKGPVLLMTHGTLAHNGMEIMATLQELFAERGISSLAHTLSLGLDNREGMYDCAVPHRHLHSDAQDEIGAWLGWLKEQGAEKVFLLGHSRGGSQVAQFAVENQDPAVSGLILIAPQTLAPGEPGRDYAKRYKKDLAPLLAEAGAKVAAGEPQALMGPIDFVYCPDTQASAAAFVSYHSDDPNQDTPGLLPKVPVPALVFGGTVDKVNPKVIERIEPLADGSKIQLKVIEGADHFFRDLYAEELADAVQEFVGL